MTNKEKRFVFVISITGGGDGVKEAWDNAVEAFAENPEEPPDKKLDAHPDKVIDPNEYYVIEEMEGDEPEVTLTP